ncbi:MAG: hypothetical protein ACOY0T_27570 [Myxococcota bacterium]
MLKVKLGLASVAASSLVFGLACGGTTRDADQTAGRPGDLGGSPGTGGVAGGGSGSGGVGIAGKSNGGASSGGASSGGTTGGVGSAGAPSAGKGGIASASGGAPGTGGATHNGGSGGSGGAIQEPRCPQTPPQDSASCSPNNQQCFYDACPSGGRTLATCMNGTWKVQSGTSCASFCQGAVSAMPCDAGEICLIMAGGALLTNCVPNLCSAGPVTSQCAGVHDCAASFSLQAGATITCNICPQGGCP